MSEQQAAMREIMAATALVRSGRREQGKHALEAIWANAATTLQPMETCALAHGMADVQDDIHEELAWDLRALEAALGCTDGAPAEPGAPSVPALMPSLHANLAEDYLKLGDLEQSRAHLVSARQFVAHLAEDAYGRFVRAGIERIGQRLDESAKG